jgi:hypothetical protein
MANRIKTSHIQQIMDNEYYCNHCKKIVKKKSNKKWIKSMCDASGYKMVRLMLMSNYKKYGNIFR